jgi:hypothetical protein
LTSLRSRANPATSQRRPQRLISSLARADTFHRIPTTTPTSGSSAKTCATAACKYHRLEVCHLYNSSLTWQRPPLTMCSMSSESDASSSEPRSSTSATPPDSHDMAPASDSSSSEPRSSTSNTPPDFYEAAHAVLNTNELICEIIGYLPFEDIIAITGVCRTWRCALYGSLAIQRALFLAPEHIRQIATSTENFPERVEDIPRRDYADVGEVNPFLARICGRCGRPTAMATHFLPTNLEPCHHGKASSIQPGFGETCSSHSRRFLTFASAYTRNETKHLTRGA